MRSGFTFFFLTLFFGMPIHGESTLKRVEWGRDSKNISILYLKFVFDQAPNHYPAFSIEKPPGVHMDFSDTRIDPNANYIQNIPPPLANLKIVEKALDEETAVTQINVSTEEKFPFYTKKKGNAVFVFFEVKAGYLKQKIFRNQVKESGENTIRHVSIHSLKEKVEVLITLTKPVPSFPVFFLDDPPRMVIDLPDVKMEKKISEEIKVGQIKSVKSVHMEDLTSLIFRVKKASAFESVQKGNQISIFLPWNSAEIARRKRWIYLSAGVLLLGGGVGAVLLGGSEDKAAGGEKPGDGEGSGSGDGWDDRPPLPKLREKVKP